MPKDILGFDYETFSEVDLLKVGTDVYANHPSTELLMGAFNLNGGEIDQWDHAQGQPIPKIFLEAYHDPEVEKWAWNSAFEMQISQHVMGLPIELPQWFDSMILGMSCSLPGKLEKAGPIINIDDEHLKNKDGTRLINKFSKTKTSRRKANFGEIVRTHWYDDLADWDNYLFYNRGDVRAEGAIRKRLAQFGSMPDHEWDLWRLDQKINRAGLPMNMRMVRNAWAVYERVLEDQLAVMRQITGLDNPNSTQQLLPWMQANGYIFDDCKAANIRVSRAYFDEKPEHWADEQWFEYTLNGDLREVLELRLETSRTSIKKYNAIQMAVGADGNLRNTLQFAGAQRTWRWAGRIFQPQNLPRPEPELEKGIITHAKNVEHLDHEALGLLYGNVFDVLASTVRPAAQAPEGLIFCDADLNAIENRVLGWLACCGKILDVYRQGKDPYIAFAELLYGIPYDILYAAYKGGDKSKRTIAKPGTLGCGYQMGPGHEYIDNKSGEKGATGLLGYAWNMGVKSFTLADSEHSVKTFRSEFSEVKDYWKGIENAAKRCIKTGKPQSWGEGYGVVTFDRLGPFMRMLLPSGRALHYVRPKIERKKAPWGDMVPTITYEGLNDRKQWVRLETHGGKLTENADQAISRDLLGNGMMLADQRGLDIRLHVHDQIVSLSQLQYADRDLKILIECMEEPPIWAPDMPLGSNGFTSPMFIKD